MTETVAPAATYARAAVRRRRHRARAPGQRDAAGERWLSRVSSSTALRRVGRDDHDARLGGGGGEQEQRECGEERAHETV